MGWNSDGDSGFLCLDFDDCMYAYVSDGIYNIKVLFKAMI